MQIGTIKVHSLQGLTIFESVFNNISISNGMLFVSIEGTFYPSLPFEKKKAYNIEITGIPEMEGSMLPATYVDYLFNAGGTDYIDETGTPHSGVCVLMNQLQFDLLT